MLTGGRSLTGGRLLTGRRLLPVLRLSLLGLPVRLVFVVAILIALVNIPAFICVHVIWLVRRPGPVVNIV